MKFLQGWKTVLFNVIMAGIAIVHSLNSEAVLPDAAAVQGVVDNFQVFFDGALIVGNVILRAVTSSPIFTKKV